MVPVRSLCVCVCVCVCISLFPPATPLWRNGPPEKPVLCNACGSRWRTKGTLLNYMPMHSGGFGGVGNPEGTARRKKGSHRLSSDPPRSHKRKEPYGGRGENRTPTPPLPLLLKDAEEDLKTASSLESGVSGPDKVALFRSSPVQSDSSAGCLLSPPKLTMSTLLFIGFSCYADEVVLNLPCSSCLGGPYPFQETHINGPGLHFSWKTH